MRSRNLRACLGHVLSKVRPVVEGDILSVIRVARLKVTGGIVGGHIEATAQHIVRVAAERRGTITVVATADAEFRVGEELHPFVKLVALAVGAVEEETALRERETMVETVRWWATIDVDGPRTAHSPWGYQCRLPRAGQALLQRHQA